MAVNAASFTKESLMNDFSRIDDQEIDIAHPIIQNQNLPTPILSNPQQPYLLNDDTIHHHEEVEENLNIMVKEKELIIKALKKHKSKRRDASADLGISERTLYRKLKEYDIDDL
jgi:DNA-binding NtrC family response regulator